MSENFIVPAKSWDDIANTANSLREALGLSDVPKLPIVEIVEQVLCNRLGHVEFLVETYDDMDGAEGLTHPNGKFIAIREDVYIDANRGDGRARFTMAHELGHWMLHAREDGRPFQRIIHCDGVPSYRLSEPQANQFAAEILMPRHLLVPGMSSQHIASTFGVSEAAARNRLNFMRKVSR